MEEIVRHAVQEAVGEVARVLEERVGTWAQGVEERLAELETALAVSSQGREEQRSSREDLERRMRNLEDTVQNALRNFALILRDHMVSPSSSSQTSTATASNPASPLFTSTRHSALGEALLKAAGKGTTGDVLKLLNDGADTNYRDRKLNTPLHEAAFSGRAEILSLLLERGADVKATNICGRTPLHCASSNESSVSLLIARGSDVHFADQSGQTPLHCAALSGNEMTVRLLMDHGASNIKKDIKGKVPSDYAQDGLRKILLSI